MADKKITIKPSDMERLRELMRQEEAKLDAADPSDEELAELEHQLESALRKLADTIPDTLPSVQSEREKNWIALQQKMQAPAKTAAVDRSAEILPIGGKTRKTKLPWLGLLAVAALLLLTVRQRSDENNLTMNDNQVVTKGNSSSKAAADCEVDVTAVSGPNVRPAPDGQGFLGPVGAELELIVICNSSGFLQAELHGPRDEYFFNVPVTDGERQRILHEGQVVRISLQSAKPWSISLVLTDREFTKGQTKPLSEGTILWQDTFSVGAQTSE